MRGVARRPDHVVDGEDEVVDVLGHALALGGVAEHLDVQSQRGYGRPQPVRQVGHEFAFIRDQSGYPGAQSVEHPTDRRHLGRP